MTKNVLQRMRDIVCFAYEHSNFYQELYDRNGINPATVNLPTGLPIVSQQDLIANSHKFRTDINVFKVCASSGTFDKPKLVYRTEDDFQISVENQIQLMKWAGVTKNDIVAIAQTFGIQSYGDLTQEATRQLGALSLPIGMISDNAAFELMKTLNATILDVSPSRLIKFLKISDQLNDDKNLSLRILMVSGEPLPPDLITEVENRWKCKIYNQYGSEETDGLGGSMEHGGELFLFEDSFIFERLDKQNIPVDNDDIGRLVITSLYHKGTPLIRYDLGDLLKFSRNKKTYIVLGRESEYILIHDSITIYPYQIDAVLESFISKEQTNWQCFISEKKHIVYIAINIINTPEYQQYKEQIIERLSNCSIDIGSLTAKGDVIFTLNFDDEPFLEKGKKYKRLIDNR